MKYIDAEKLREEIEFAKSVYSNPHRVVHGIADAFRQDGRVAMCDDILKKLDSLQQEQTGVDLEKDIEKICDFNKAQTTITLTKGGLRAAAYHFYELGLKAGKEE